MESAALVFFYESASFFAGVCVGNDKIVGHVERPGMSSQNPTRLVMNEKAN